MSNRSFAIMRHPRWSHEDLPEFAEHYDTIVHKFYHLDDPSPVKSFSGPEAGRICVFCGATEATASFSKEAHIIPASFANRHFFSNEECDDCNNTFGDQSENELASMLFLDRAIFGVRGRRGGRSPEADAFDGETTVRRDPGGGTLSITSDAATSPLQVDEASKSFVIVGHSKPFRPVQATISLLRTAWMFLTHEQRQRNQIILDVIRNPSVPSPFQLIRLHVPGANPRKAEFWVWERKGDADLAECLLGFRVGHTVLIWTAPFGQPLHYAPSLLPLIETHPEAPPPTGRVMEINAVDHVARGGRERFEFSFESIRRNVAATPSGNPPPEFRLKHDVTVTLTLDDFSESLRSKMTIGAPESSNLTCTVSGIEFGARMEFLAPENGGQLEFRIKATPHAVSLGDARRTLSLLSRLGAAGSELRIEVTGQPELGFRSSGPSASVPADYSDELQFIDWLVAINSEFGTSLQFPLQLQSEDYDGAALLAALIARGRVAVAPGDQLVPLALSPRHGGQVIDSIEQGESFCLAVQGWVISLLGETLSIGAMTISYLSPSMDSSEAEAARQILGTLGENETTVIQLRVSRLLYEAERWVPS